MPHTEDHQGAHLLSIGRVRQKAWPAVAVLADDAEEGQSGACRVLLIWVSCAIQNTLSSRSIPRNGCLQSISHQGLKPWHSHLEGARCHKAQAASPGHAQQEQEQASLPAISHQQLPDALPLRGA